MIILDRDGVINQDSPDFIKSPEEFHFLPGSIDAIVRLTQAGHRVGVASNQSGIARGHLTEDTLQQIHHKMQSTIQEHGGILHDIAYCPHGPEEGCVCRKPKPGMLIHMADSHGVPWRDVIFIGDRISDIRAAEAMGAQAIHVQSTATETEVATYYPMVPSFKSLSAFVDQFLQRYASIR